MGTEIIRRSDAGLSLARSVDARQAMDTALARLRGNGGAQQRQRPLEELAPMRSVAQDVADLPRYCSVHGEPYVSRYVRSKGRFRYAQSFRFKPSLQDQYARDAAAQTVVPNGDLGEESCPWCGASGHAAIRCGVCKRLMCFGKTVGRYFRCDDTCRGEGNYVTTQDPQGGGLNPGRERNFGGFGT